MQRTSAWTVWSGLFGLIVIWGAAVAVAVEDAATEATYRWMDGWMAESDDEKEEKEKGESKCSYSVL